MLLTFPERRLRHLDWVQAHVLFLCMLVASAHRLGMHGPTKHTQTQFKHYALTYTYLFIFLGGQLSLIRSQSS